MQTDHQQKFNIGASPVRSGKGQTVAASVL
jgi:hypothetical protein